VIGACLVAGVVSRASSQALDSVAGCSISLGTSDSYCMPGLEENTEVIVGFVSASFVTELKSRSLGCKGASELSWLVFDLGLVLKVPLLAAWVE